MKRNRRAAVEDLWLKTLRDENGNTTTVPSALHGRVAVAGSVCRRRRPRACEAVFDQSAGAALARSPDVESRASYPCRAEGREDHRRAAVRGLQRQPPEQCQLRSPEIRMIVREFGHLALSEVRPSQVKTWCARMKTDGYAVSTISRAHSSPVGLERQTEHTSHEVGFHQLRLTGDEVGHLTIQFADQ